MRIGYQLYSAAEFCQNADALKNTIKKIASLGYDGVEFFNYQGIPAAEMKEFLDECNIVAMNSHVQFERWEADPEGEIRYALDLGMQYITIPWIAPNLRNAEGYEKVKTIINRIAPICKKNGIKLCYHNHDFEFAKNRDGRFVLNEILNSEDNLYLELDTFWTHFAGVNPVAYMEQHKDKLALVHMKDYKERTGGPLNDGVSSPIFAAVGTGKMDCAAICNKCKELEMMWTIVEQDNSDIDVFESASLSIEYLKEFFY